MERESGKLREKFREGIVEISRDRGSDMERAKQNKREIEREIQMDRERETGIEQE